LKLVVHSQDESMSLDSQIQAMVEEGAALGETEQGLIFPIGILILDEAGKRLLSMNQWAQGTGDAHVFRWDQVEQLPNQVVFSTGGKVAFGIAPFAEWPELDQNAIQESFAGWRLELEKNRSQYQRFARAEFGILTS
jgi:hypothetical protein